MNEHSDEMWEIHCETYISDIPNELYNNDDDTPVSL